MMEFFAWWGSRTPGKPITLPEWASDLPEDAPILAWMKAAQVTPVIEHRYHQYSQIKAEVKWNLPDERST